MADAVTGDGTEMQLRVRGHRLTGEAICFPAKRGCLLTPRLPLRDRHAFLAQLRCCFSFRFLRLHRLSDHGRGAVELDHALEVQLPFLQMMLDGGATLKSAHEQIEALQIAA